jgi:hypothetical protein
VVATEILTAASRSENVDGRASVCSDYVAQNGTIIGIQLQNLTEVAAGPTPIL